MNTRGTSLTAVLLVGQALVGLVLAAPAAHAQSAVSSRTSHVVGAVAPSAALDPAAEQISCSGDVKITTRAVSDPTMPPGVVVSIDARGVSCLGHSTRASYVSTGQANLTRLLVPNDVIETTLALYRDVPGGPLKARTALLTLNLSYDTTTGALTSVTGSVGTLP